ncbi:MAG: rhamnose:proton symporter [Verrucomicrobia bacterium]|nr:rhamnose:proton symporter [Verrucomicrobiota bacterium]
MPPQVASIVFHAIGAAAAACCYAPQKKVKGWSWQSYWLAQAMFCWLLLPIASAFLTVPGFWLVVQTAPPDAMVRTFLLGIVYGVGGTAFGMAIRYVGFSITYASAIGISTVVGTAYAITKGDSTLAAAGANVQAFLDRAGANWVVVGIAIGVVGVALCGLAGRWKERDQTQGGGSAPADRNLLTGFALCVLAGVLSAVYGMSLTEGAPIAKLAEERAAGHTVLGIDAATFGSNAIYPFSNAGAFLTTALYCLFLHRRHGTLGELVALPREASRGRLARNWALAILTGCLWYGQFFFYGFGKFYIAQVAGFEQTCWAIHMILLILLGTLIGVIFKEWKGCRPRTHATLGVALALLIVGKLLLDYGNYLGTRVAN